MSYNILFEVVAIPVLLLTVGWCASSRAKALRELQEAREQIDRLKQRLGDVGQDPH